MTTWMTYIGGKYSNKGRFITEARAYGISRRVAAQVARGFRFGDRVILLRYNGKRGVEAFAEMRITEIIFDHEIASQIGAKLREMGLATYQAGSLGASNVHRECGDYVISGGWTVDGERVNIPDLVKAAQELANGDTVFCMIGGKLTEEYQSVVWLSPAPKFTRGFIKSGDVDDTFQPEDNRMVEIKDYRRR